MIMSLNYTSMKFSKNPYGILLTYSVKALNVYRYNSNTNFSELYKKSWRVFLCLVFPAEFCSLAAVKIYYFLKITWLCDRWVMISSRWGPLTLTHNPTKFGGHWHCGCGNSFFFENHVIIRLMSHMTRWMRSPFPKSQRL